MAGPSGEVRMFCLGLPNSALIRQKALHALLKGHKHLAPCEGS